MTNLFPPPQRMSPAQETKIREVLLAATAAQTATRQRPLRRRLVVSVASAAGISAGLSLALSLSGPQPALAAWTAVPQPVSPDVASRLTQSCTTLVAGHFPIKLGRVTFSLGERRGTSSAVLLAGSAGAEAICVTPSAQTGGSFGVTGVAGPVVGIGAIGPAKGKLTIDGVAGGPGIGATAVYGRVTSQAVKVLVTTRDGKVVTASISRGYFLAWWPSGADVATIRVLDTSGRTIAAVTEASGGTGLPVPRHSPAASSA